MVGARLERQGLDPDEGPILYVDVHVFEGYRNDETPSGVSWKNHTIVTFLFAGVVTLSLNDFNNQNAIMDLLIESTGKHPNSNMPAYRVTFQPAFGIDCSFVCSGIEIHDVQSKIPPGSVYAE